jgi:hypothetical protein
MAKRNLPFNHANKFLKKQINNKKIGRLMKTEELKLFW